MWLVLLICLIGQVTRWLGQSNEAQGGMEACIHEKSVSTHVVEHGWYEKRSERDRFTPSQAVEKLLVEVYKLGASLSDTQKLTFDIMLQITPKFKLPKHLVEHYETVKKVGKKGWRYVVIIRIIAPVGVTNGCVNINGCAHRKMCVNYVSQDNIDLEVKLKSIRRKLRSQTK